MLAQACCTSCTSAEAPRVAADASSPTTTARLRVVAPPSVTSTRSAEDARALWTQLLPQLRADRLDDQRSVSERGVAVLSLGPRPLVLAFWATYCPPCMEEMPMFEELHREGRAIAGLSMDAENRALVAKVLDHRAVHYPNAILTEDSVKAAGLALDEGLPFTVVVDREDRVRAIIRGQTTREALLNILGSGTPR